MNDYIINRVGGTNIERSTEFTGKSTSIKPTKANGHKELKLGDYFVEIDTKEVYFYDPDSDNWV